MMLLAYTAFAIGVASPGPSVLAVMGTAMAQGRARALALASGVVCGSLCWGLCAAFGLAALMERWSGALAVVKAIGGVYLLWMAWQAARKVRGDQRIDLLLLCTGVFHRRRAPRLPGGRALGECRAGRRVRVCGRAHAAGQPGAVNQIRTRLSR
ncbi:LysE family translocator [Massilia orientalis]|jgi:hypothetical protein|uniref:LysE family translocator n=1 Tax=Massilia orientalis TaxID=3050128 RepID=A0ACC7MLS5_9BURK|nr:LysE family translocator [Massilia sp. YIM B02787]